MNFTQKKFVTYIKRVQVIRQSETEHELHNSGKCHLHE